MGANDGGNHSLIAGGQTHRFSSTGAIAPTTTPKGKTYSPAKTVRTTNQPTTFLRRAATLAPSTHQPRDSAERWACHHGRNISQPIGRGPEVSCHRATVSQHDRILANGKTPQRRFVCFFDCEAGRGEGTGRRGERGQSDGEGHALATIRGFRICPTLGQGTWPASINTTTGPTAPFPHDPGNYHPLPSASGYLMDVTEE